MNSSFKVLVVVITSVLLTSAFIQASDSLLVSGGNLASVLIGGENKKCPSGMVEVLGALSYTCIDKFEASASANCAIADPSSEVQTSVNLENQSCRSESEGGVIPWRFLTREQAMTLCARSDKRLPTASEWYQAALSTDKTKCEIDRNEVSQTGKKSDCLSAAGTMDQIGNVWEWVTDDVIAGQYQGRELPVTGYVTQVDNGGVPTETTDELASDGYFWSETGESAAYAMMRGGFYGSRSDAGIYTIHAANSPNFTGAAVGFRCVR